jgi:hypothetical protein
MAIQRPVLPISELIRITRKHGPSRLKVTFGGEETEGEQPILYLIPDVVGGETLIGYHRYTELVLVHRTESRHADRAD